MLSRAASCSVLSMELLQFYYSGNHTYLRDVAIYVEPPNRISLQACRSLISYSILLQPFRIAAVHPAVLRFPAVVGQLADAVLPGQLCCRQSCLALLQNRDDLFFAMSCTFHCASPFQFRMSPFIL